MRRLRKTGHTDAQIADALRAEGHPTKRGGNWSQPVVSRILRRDAARTPQQRAYHQAQIYKHEEAASE